MKNLAILGGNPIGPLEMPRFPYYDEKDIQGLTETLCGDGGLFRNKNQSQLEADFAAFCGVPYAISAANGTVTLRLAMEALGIGPGDEVIVPGLTWQATAASVLDVNAVPILVDIDPGTYTIDPKAVEAAITERTKAIIPVHLYGRMADMDALTEIARKHQLSIIEDCAHQHGSRWRGEAAGSIGDIGSFSLQASKILNCGEGGILTTKDSKLSELLMSLRNCGRPVHSEAAAMQSGNFRLSELQASLAVTQLSRLESQNAIREKNARYIESRLEEIEGIRPMVQNPNVTLQVYFSFTLRYDAKAWEGVPRDKFLEAFVAELNHSAIRTFSTYEPLHMSPLYQPHSKKTYKLSEEHWKQIDPQRYELPVCKMAFEEEAINFHHTILLTNQEGCDLFIEALHKLRANIGELKAFASDVQ